MKVLVTNGAYKHTLALVRALGAAGHSVGVVAHRSAAVSFFSKYCTRRHVVKSNNKQIFVDTILEILQKEKYDVLLPVGLPTVVWLAERAEDIRQLTHMPLADVDKIKLFENKQYTHDLSVKLNIPTPLTFFPKDRSDADICAAQLTLPIVVKHGTRSGADWLRYAHSVEEAVSFFEKMADLELKILAQEKSELNAQNTEGGNSELKTSLQDTKQKKLDLKNQELINTHVDNIDSELKNKELNAKNTEGSNSDLKMQDSELNNELPLQTSNVKRQTILFQEYLSGGGFGFFGLYEKGVFKQGFVHQRIREFPVSGGASCCAKSIDNQQLMAIGRRVLEAVSWHGVAMVEFKMDSNGQPRLLEVNPKLWGSFDLSVAAGVPFAEKWVQLAIGEPIADHQTYQNNIQFSWLMNGDLRHGLKTGNFWKILRGGIFDKNTQTNLIWHDPLAALFLILSGLKP